MEVSTVHEPVTASNSSVPPVAAPPGSRKVMDGVAGADGEALEDGDRLADGLKLGEALPLGETLGDGLLLGERLALGEREAEGDPVATVPPPKSSSCTPLSLKVRTPMNPPLV